MWFWFNGHNQTDHQGDLREVIHRAPGIPHWHLNNIVINCSPNWITNENTDHNSEQQSPVLIVCFVLPVADIFII
jgi:hypothetical protein